MVKVLGKILNFVTVFLIAACFLLTAPVLLNKKPYIVMSGSMEPNIHTGSVAYVDRNFSGDDAKIGDVIAFTTGDIFVTHRVIEINDDNELITKGDANDAEDLAPVPRQSVIGKTVFSVPYVGYVIKTLKGRMMIYIVALFVLAHIMIGILQSEDSETEDEKDSTKEKEE